VPITVNVIASYCIQTGAERARVKVVFRNSATDCIDVSVLKNIYHEFA